MKKDILEKSFEDVPIVKKGDYSYVIHPLTDGVPYISSDLLEDVVNRMENKIKNLLPFDRIVTMEAMGIPYATLLSHKMGIPFTIIRKRKYDLPKEFSVSQITGYSKSDLFINGLKKGDRVVIVDDVLSTGGTLKAVLSALKDIGVFVKGVFVAVNKGSVLEEIKKDFDVDIECIVCIDVVDDKVVIRK